jgi:hypothetical protein
MKNVSLVMLAAGMVLIAVGAWATPGDGTEFQSAMPVYSHSGTAGGFTGTRLETLWIFDADFSTETGDNAGWTTFDRSGTIATENYWHHDTIRIGGFAHLGDSTWWCGTYNECWRQPRGYANEWVMVLERGFPEIEANTDPGDVLTLDWDQRFAMEHDYDYGYVEVSDDAGTTWTTLYSANNPGFAGKPGLSQDWDSPAHGHKTLDLSTYAGQNIELRFRFESDEAYSSQDQYNNGPPNNSVLDGAWQLDNITWTGPGGAFWLDDCESGNMGWVHDDVEAAGQTGIVFYRGELGVDFVTGRPFTCDDRQGWMYAAVDPFTSTMVDEQYSWLMSPPIDISGAPKLVGHWDFWLDMPRESNDICNLNVASNDDYACVTDPSGFVDESPGWWYGDAGWRVRYDDWDAFAGNDWLAILWEEQNDELPEPGGQHWAGIIFNRQRVGIPSGDAGTTFQWDTWNAFNDWFDSQLSEAMLDSARLLVKDDDGIATLYVVATNDEGATYNSYNCHREDPESNTFICSPPYMEMTPGSEIHYYFEATDELGNVSVLPPGAPDQWFEMSILPISATVSNQGVLLVDKHGRYSSGADRETGWGGSYAEFKYRPTTDSHTLFYYEEMLGILGYDYEIYDVEVPSGSTDQSNGPDSSGYKYYDTQIWFTHSFNAYTIKAPDQLNLINWLNQAGAGKDRNLVLTGNDIGFELIEGEKETLAFYETWMATDYIENQVGVSTVDSLPGLEDATGGSFMTHDDGEAIALAACPNPLEKFDVIQPFAGIPGTEQALQYIKTDESTRPAGVAYTHQTLGYNTVNFGFGMEYIMDGVANGGSANYTPEGYYHTGIEDRVNLMENVMTFLNKTPDGDGTGVDGALNRNVLSAAYPNPFNPVTKIAYSVREAGPVTIRVYNASGRTVRTLMDSELDAGASGHVVWDGTNDGGERCASGVYFYRIEAPGFATSRKMVMLK